MHTHGTAQAAYRPGQLVVFTNHWRREVLGVVLGWTGAPGWLWVNGHDGNRYQVHGSMMRPWVEG